MRSIPVMILGTLLFGMVLTAPPPVWAGNEMNVAGNASLIMRGAVKTVGAAFQVPMAMMQDSARVMFPFGILTGAVRGSMKTVAGVMSGALDIAQGGAPYAKYAVFV